MCAVTVEDSGSVDAVVGAADSFGPVDGSVWLSPPVFADLHQGWLAHTGIAP